MPTTLLYALYLMETAWPHLRGIVWVLTVAWAIRITFGPLGTLLIRRRQ